MSNVRSSSEIFGQPTTMPQTEESPINPASPYGCAKAFATQMVRIVTRTPARSSISMA
jgi:GDP-D-mannose dehydratase